MTALLCPFELRARTAATYSAAAAAGIVSDDGDGWAQFLMELPGWGEWRVHRSPNGLFHYDAEQLRQALAPDMEPAEFEAFVLQFSDGGGGQ